MAPLSRLCLGLLIVLSLGRIPVAAAQVQPPRLVHVPTLQYPPLAHTTCTRGRVAAVVTITPAGTVNRVDVLYGSQFFREYARAFFRELRFGPSADSSQRREAIHLRFWFVPRATPPESLGVIVVQPADIELRDYPPDISCQDCSDEGRRQAQLEHDRQCFASPNDQ